MNRKEIKEWYSGLGKKGGKSKSKKKLQAINKNLIKARAVQAKERQDGQ